MIPISITVLYSLYIVFYLTHLLNVIMSWNYQKRYSLHDDMHLIHISILLQYNDIPDVNSFYYCHNISCKFINM